ncbi:GMC family oxidoreductase [Novacetimonas pomaceti]|uniref:GMC family oxidoreductase n=1 Tax=Novacetimonas pomaceti TaxID=2021998 RepID=UPI001C2D6A4F|nr:GMC family oxidoreductase [Novacetimonas pomaceti]MBV1834130.1 GMC family oxidoreductase [Novacetimonas pomaceti]
MSTESEFAGHAGSGQRRPEHDLRSRYSFIVCGSGASGSVIARRLAESPDVSVLLIEAGGSDNVPAVMQANQWPLNLGSERDWNFPGEPGPHVNNRVIPYSMGKVLGGGTSINVMVWARGHKRDWDLFSAAADDPAWSYEAVLKLYRRIENWHGVPDPARRGVGGPMFVEPAPDPCPLAPATMAAARSTGIPLYESPNGRMMESDGGASITDVCAKDGVRQSVFRSYVCPYMDKPNLTVLTGTTVTRIIFDGKRAAGIEAVRKGEKLTFAADFEIILSLGAVQTPKILMQSGIGEKEELEQSGIPVVAHRPGVGRNLQDHVAFDCVWEYRTPLPPRNTMSEAFILWKSRPELTCPDLLICQAEVPKSTVENIERFGLPEAGWTLFGGVAHPVSRGRIRLTGRNSSDPVRLETNVLANPADMKAAIACVELCREIGNSRPLELFVKREVMPGPMKGRALENFVRNAATSFWHLCGTARMGHDDMAVVDNRLRVHGIKNLRIADASIMPVITTGNTMAPCVVIGEFAARAIEMDYGMTTSARTQAQR